MARPTGSSATCLYGLSTSRSGCCPASPTKTLTHGRREARCGCTRISSRLLPRRRPLGVHDHDEVAGVDVPAKSACACREARWRRGVASRPRPMSVGSMTCQARVSRQVRINVGTDLPRRLCLRSWPRVDGGPTRGARKTARCFTSRLSRHNDFEVPVHFAAGQNGSVRHRAGSEAVPMPRPASAETVAWTSRPGLALGLLNCAGSPRWRGQGDPIWVSTCSGRWPRCPIACLAGSLGGLAAPVETRGQLALQILQLGVISAEVLATLCWRWRVRRK